MAGARKRSASDQQSSQTKQREKFARLIVSKFMERYPALREEAYLEESELFESTRYHLLRRTVSSPATLGHSSVYNGTSLDLLNGRPAQLAETLQQFWQRPSEDQPSDDVNDETGTSSSTLARSTSVTVSSTNVPTETAESFGAEDVGDYIDEATVEKITQRLSEIALELEHHPDGTRISDMAADNLGVVPELNYAVFSGFLDNVVHSSAFPQQFQEPYHQVAFVLFVSFLFLKRLNESVNKRVLSVLEIAARYTATFVAPKFAERRTSDVFCNHYCPSPMPLTSPSLVDSFFQSELGQLTIRHRRESTVDPPALFLLETGVGDEDLSRSDSQAQREDEENETLEDECFTQSLPSTSKSSNIPADGTTAHEPNQQCSSSSSEDDQQFDSNSGPASDSEGLESREEARANARTTRRSRSRVLSEHLVSVAAGSPDAAVATVLTLALCAAYFNYRNS